MEFKVVKNKFYVDAKETKIISGAVHYFRNMPDTWEDIFKKMKAMGCNCVETYCAWNMHEKVQGSYDFSGILDIAEFIRTAEKCGLMVIVRPGPYICAEWEFGGLPWWIQNMEGMEIRCSNEKYIHCFEQYLVKLFEQIKPYLCTNGGPVIMMQCENEYGYYGDDKVYLKHLYEFYRSSGIDVPLFTSDGTSETDLLDGTVEGCFSTLNFGSRVEENFAVHDRLFPDQPKMGMEMWNGWFDAWGDECHHTTSAKDYAKVVDDMLKRGSINMYMFIGGTNFGFTSGANHYETFAPDVTSYDYDALLSECGDTTEKYFAVREVIQKYIDYELPPVPENRVKKAYGKVKLTKSCELFKNLSVLSNVVKSNVPGTMESYNQGYGYIAYQTVLNRDYQDAPLMFERIGDRANIFINDTRVGNLYVNDPELKINISAKAGDVLTILCENMGRTNFGPKMMYKKGLVGRVLLGLKIHFNWDVYTLPMTDFSKLEFGEIGCADTPTFFKGEFEVKGEPADTFLRTDNFRKGFVVVNGFNIGRYWEVGPQKTLYVPKSVLKEGMNEIILFESDGMKAEAELEFVDAADLGLK